jgi:RNA polymerase sigma factor (TIGR02999 family)
MLGDLLRGDTDAGERVIPMIYQELRALAGMVNQESTPSDFRPTELIHEAYVRLVDVDVDQARHVESRLHFKRLAVRAMRGVLVDRARANRSAKRGGAQRDATLHEDAVASVHDDQAVLEVHDGLNALRATDERLAEMVELRFFGGFDVAEVARALGVSERTVHRDWRLVQAWWLEEYDADARDPD